MVPKKRNIISIVVLCLVVNMSLPSRVCLGSDGEIAAKKANAKLAATLAINKLREIAKERQIEIDFLSKKMNDNPKGYQEKRESWDKLQEEERKGFSKWYEKEVEDILKGLDRRKPEGVKSYFTDGERKNFLQCSEEVVRGYLGKNFGRNYLPADKTTVFSKAREKASTLQWDRITKNIYPAESEIDVAVSANKMEELRQSLLSRIINNQKETVFSENQDLLSRDVVNPILNDARTQLGRQGEIVRNSTGGSLFLPEDIKKFIEDEIGRYRSDLTKSKAGDKVATKVYNIFSSIGEKTGTRSNELAIERFKGTISNLTSPVGEDKIKSLIVGNLSAHISNDKSWAICQEQFRKEIVDKAINDYAAKAPKEKQLNFRAFVQKLLSSDKSCQDAMGSLVVRSLRQDFDNAREKISSEQFNEFFEPLEKETWKPSEQEIDGRYNRPSINSSAVSEPLKMPGISSKSFDSASLLEETIEMVRQAEESAIKRGLDALKGQMDTVEKLELQMKNQIKDMDDLTIDKVAEIYTEKVESVWSSSIFAKDYADLFTRTQNEIKRRAKDILDLEIARQRQVVVDKTRADKARADAEAQLKDKGRSETFSIEGKKPGTGNQDANTPGGQPGDRGGDPNQFGSGIPGLPGGGKGPGKEEKEIGDILPDVILDFSSQYGKVYTEMMFLKEQRAGAKLEIQSNVRRNLPSLLLATKIFADWLKDASQKAKKDQQEINVYVLVRVFDGSSVSYSMVYYFRECLIAALEQVGDKRIKIHWYDKLFDEPDDVDKYKGKPVLPPKFDKNLMPRLV